MRLFIIILFLFSFSSFSQFGFDKIEHDFGDIYSGNKRFADLKFRNNTGGKVYLLRVAHGKEIQILVNTAVILPDSLMIIRIKYNPTKKGKFKIPIPVYLSNSMEPFEFVIQGNVREIDNSLGVACPSFDAKIIEEVSVIDFKVTVLDEETHKPIKKASVTFVSDGVVTQEESTNIKGEVKTNSFIGLFYFVIAANEYRSVEFPKYINRNQDSILVYLAKPKEIKRAEKEEELVEELEIKIEKELPTEIKKEEQVEDVNIEEEIIEFAPVYTSKKDTELIPEPVFQDIPIEDSIQEIKEIKPPKYIANNIVFLIDVSSSMHYEGKLDLLKSSLIEMVNELRDEDRITLISYSSSPKVLLEAISGSEKEKLKRTIKSIKASGTTAGGDGMKWAYRRARKYYLEKGNNQVIMATDGKFNSGVSNLDRLVEKNLKKGIKLTVLGIKNKPEHAESMKKYAIKGGGRFLIIDSFESSREVLVNEIKRISWERKK